MDAMTRFKILWQGYLTDTLNADEAEELLTLIRKDECFHKDHIAGLLAAPPELGIDRKEGDEIFEELLSRIHEPAQVIRRIPILRRWSWAAAAIIVIGTAIAIAISSDHRSATSDTAVTTNYPSGIPPGKEGAVLTLADGREVVLDSMGNGVVATQNGTQVVLNDGRLTYDPTENTTGAIVFNTMSTPKGRQFSVMLPDGTEVWLNAASSIRYPASFTGNERRVSITGEAYFDVAKNKSKPFFVDIDGKASIEVLGTSFNINAYSDEPVINTALLEGAVRMTALADPQNRTQSGKTEPSIIVLRPGQQAVIDKSGGMKVGQADRSMVMAWREGVFRYDNTDFDVVLRQLSRWYDIDVQYEKGIPDQQFTGEIRRDYTLSQALSILEGMDVHFRLEGKKLIVLP